MFIAHCALLGVWVLGAVGRVGCFSKPFHETFPDFVSQLIKSLPASPLNAWTAPTLLESPVNTSRLRVTPEFTFYSPQVTFSTDMVALTKKKNAGANVLVFLSAWVFNWRGFQLLTKAHNLRVLPLTVKYQLFLCTLCKTGFMPLRSQTLFSTYRAALA